VTGPSFDPRVYFAAERTLLAWLRTGLGIMAFGFVVARFGLFLRLVQAQGAPMGGDGASQYLGAALVSLGVVASAAGAVQYFRFCRRLPRKDLPETGAVRVPLTLAGTLVALGLVLVVLLLV
jgi:putative membrane protein